MLGRYELVRVLGRGGMAEVYLARRRGPGGVEKRLAIKRIRRERATDPRLLEMFVSEARLSMAMVHRNIVPMFDFGRVGDELFLVMEYVDGADLGAALEGSRARNAPLPAAVAGYIAMEACQALDYAHSARGADAAGLGVVHRDVNPRNVLLSYNGEVKLMDFGVATTETDLGAAGKVRGTPAYMAPEQARGEAVDPRADLFAIGLVLWEALVGRRAYAGDDVASLLASARAGVVPPLPDSVPGKLREIVATATAPEPADRYPSARAMQIELDDFLVGARAGDTRTPPLDHQLSAWLREVCPPSPTFDGAASVAVPEGKVVTFLEQGEAEIEGREGPTPRSFGRATLASIAETVAESESEPTDASAGPAVGPPQRARRLRSLGLWAVVGGAAVAVVWFAVRGPDASSAKGAGAEARASQPPTPARVEAMTGDRPQRETAALSAPGRNDGTIASAPVEVPAGGASAAESSAGELDAPPAPRSQAPAPGTRTHSPTARAPSVAEADRSARSAPASVDPGMVRISSAPWAAVEVEGREGGCAETPCTLRLPAGTYMLLLRNPVAELEKRVEVEVIAGKTTDVVATLTPHR